MRVFRMIRFSFRIAFGVHKLHFTGIMPNKLNVNQRRFSSVLLLVISYATILAETNDVPVLFVEKETFNFGKVITGKDVEIRFEIQNTGKRELLLYDVSPSCAICTDDLSWPGKLAPNEKGHIGARLQTGELQGSVDRTLSIYSNHKEKRIILHITGQVWSPLELKPSYAYFPTLKSIDSNTDLRVGILNKVPEEVTLSRPRCDNLKFQPKLITEEKGRKYTLIVLTVPPMEFGTNSGLIKIDTSYPGLPNILIRATAKVSPPLEFSPSMIFLKTGKLKNPIRKIVRLSVNSTEPVEILEHSLNLEGPTVEVIERKPGKYIRFAISFPKGFHVEPNLSASLLVRTSHKQFSQLNLPVQAYANVTQRKND